jgi:hypothetical protein
VRVLRPIPKPVDKSRYREPFLISSKQLLERAPRCAKKASASPCGHIARPGP